MKKIIYIIFFYAIFIQIAFADNFRAKYSQHIDIYNFLENLSEWDSAHTLKSYKEYWKKHKLNQFEDVVHLNNFRKIKLKHYHTPKEKLFAENDLNEDKIKEVFLKSKSYQESYIALSDVLTSIELEAFNDCYQHFLSRIIKVVKPHYAYNETLKKINALNSDNEISNYINHAKLFYKSSKIIENPIIVNIVWQPEEGGAIAYYINKSIVLSLKSSDAKKDLNIKRLTELTSILFHEMMHYHSSLMEHEAKADFSSTLNIKLPIKNIYKKDLGLIIEEPLAVILGQQLFYKKFKKEYYNPYDDVYQNEWVKLMALIAAPLVEHYIYYGYPMDKSFIQQYINLSIMALQAKDSLRDIS